MPQPAELARDEMQEDRRRAVDQSGVDRPTVVSGDPEDAKKTRSACRKLAKKRKAWTMRTYYVPGLTAWDRGNQNGYCEIIR